MGIIIISSSSITISSSSSSSSSIAVVIVVVLVVVVPIPLAVRSKAWVCGRSLSGIADPKPAEAWISVYCEFCVLSGRGLCDGSIIHPENSYRVWCA